MVQAHVAPFPCPRPSAAPAPLACALVAVLLALSAPAASAQAGPHLHPDGPEFIANDVKTFTQHQGRVAMAPDGGRFAVTWASAVGSDIYVRLFAGDGTPLTPDVLVNGTFVAGLQDEPSVAMDGQGRFLVAWSDRAGFDGFQMGVFARAFHASGDPMGPEFQVNVMWQQSQWEPFLAARPAGGWVVGWTGTDGGRTFMRLLAPDGTPETGEIEVASVNDQQLCPVPAVARDGRIFFAWIDFNGKAGLGNGTSIYGRVFGADGTPLGPEFQVNTTDPGEQREPKTAADGLGTFMAVWEDRAPDAEGTDVHARRYDATGTPLGPEFRVNVTGAGGQVLPSVTMDWLGNALFVWEDRSVPGSDVVARRFDAFDQPLTGEFALPSTAAGAQSEPFVATDWSGQSIVGCWSTLGVTVDVAVRRWRFDALTAIGPPILGQPLRVELDLPSGVGLWRLVLMSFGTLPGLPLPDGRTLRLNDDPLFKLVLGQAGSGGIFPGFTGFVPDGLPDKVVMNLPFNPNLVGVTLHLAVLSLDLGEVGLAQQLRHVTLPLAVTLL